MDQVVFDGASLITPEAIAAELTSAPVRLADASIATARAELAIILNFARQQFERGAEPARTIDWTATQLHRARGKFQPAVWRQLIAIAQHHPVADFFLQDPFTRWSFEKPRGYSGDAQLLDFIYGHPCIEAEVKASSALGRQLYDYTKAASSSVAVRERRDILTSYVDETAARRAGRAEILTVAAGHLREADRSIALETGQIGRWVALDQDPTSVGLIRRDFAGTAVEAVDGSVRGMLARGERFGSFDLIYAAGLYDYLALNVAVKLTQKCVRMLKPGGMFLFANFADGIGVDGYMETFMNWALLLRSEADMWAIVNGSVDRNTVDAEVFFGANRNILYGVIRKRG